MNGYEVAHEIAQNMKSHAVTSRAHCLFCKRLVAAVVRHGGEPWLFEPGGREESADSRSAALKEVMPVLPRGGDDAAELVEEQLRAIAEADRGQAGRRAAFAVRLSAVASLFGFPYQKMASCPGCSRLLDLHLDEAGTVRVTRQRQDTA